jgi:hypothetical protein
MATPTPFGTRFVRRDRNTQRGRRVSFVPTMEPFRKRLEEERRKKEEEKEQEKNTEIQKIASALRPEEIANYKKQFTVDKLDRMARDQLIWNGLSREEGEQQLPNSMKEHLTNRLARDKYNEQEQVRVHSEDEGNQRDRHSEEELLAVIPDNVLDDRRERTREKRLLHQR